MGEKELRFSSFMFVKVAPAFRHLISNEKIAAKQELEGMVALRQDDLFLRTYSLQGLRAEFDMLLWLVSSDITHLQQAWSNISATGAGRYLVAKKSFLGFFELTPEQMVCEQECGVVPAGLFGKYQYMLLHPLSRTCEWHQMSAEEQTLYLTERKNTLEAFPSVAEHMFESYGLDDQDCIVVRESNNLRELAAVTQKLREKRIKHFAKCDTPSLLCIGSDLRVILDRLGN
ncbi:MAG: chlorite dismutase family protein [Elusimicrobiaceae bacterium]|jgi:chlorite dismutase